ERPEVLDAASGTDIFQMPPGRMKLTAGTDAVRCLFRWYTDCCRTPIANTAAGPCFPVVALIHSFMDPGSESRPETRCSARGCAVSTNAPPSDRSRRRRPRDYRSARRASKILGCWLRGFARPNPFFDDLRAPCRACSPGASAQPFIKNHFVMETATIKLAHDRIPKLAPDKPPKLNVVIT